MKEKANGIEHGFTLIELVVVILILSVLAATALPRFMNVQSQAHESSVAGLGGSFGSAVAMVHAQWLANGNTGAANDIAGFGLGNVDMDNDGWPVGTTNGTPSCAEVWTGILQDAPPLGSGRDYQASGTITVNGSGDATGTCSYVYYGNGNTGYGATDNRRMEIRYTADNGNVCVDSSLTSDDC